MSIFKIRQKALSDIDVIIGLQNHNHKIEKYFFDTSYNYFANHFSLLFFDADSRQEVFQTAIIKLWTEIENKTIKIVGNTVCRRQKSGEYTEMSATLNTFMMAFAKNEFRELLRNRSDDNFDDIANTSKDGGVNLMDESSDEDEDKIQIIDECILSMSPNCIEIITMFYYQKMSLDEIMVHRGEKNTSKDGLKTAKNKCMVTLRKRVNERLNMN